MNEGKLESEVNAVVKKELSKMIMIMIVYVPTLTFWVVNENVDTSSCN